MIVLVTPPDVKPDPEVSSKIQKRVFSADYKRRILEEVEACEPGQIGAILRREGLYSAHLTDWRRQRMAGTLEFNAKVKQGRPLKDPRDSEIERLRSENARLAEKLRKADIIIDVQKNSQRFWESNNRQKRRS